MIYLNAMQNNIKIQFNERVIFKIGYFIFSIILLPALNPLNSYRLYNNKVFLTNTN